MEIDLESEEVQTLEDAFSGRFCRCTHLLNEHSMGFITKTVKCHALCFNGIWSGCDCSSIKPFKFEIGILIEIKDDK